MSSNNRKRHLTLSIMQPYFFPHIGYFQLMHIVDKWVVFDDIQYIRNGWINRNRILSPNLAKGWQYISLPLKKHSRTDLINDIKLQTAENWQNSIVGKLSYYKKIGAPYFEEIMDILQRSFLYDANKLSEFNVQSLKVIANYLDITFDYVVSSEQNFDYSAVNDSGDWAFEISRQMSASLYINPIGGRELFNREKFHAKGIDLKFLQTAEFSYRQSRRDYISGLSIIDVLMFNSIEEVKEMLNKYELVC